jgi:hypothetical protein
VLVVGGVVFALLGALAARLRASYGGSTGHLLQDRLPGQYPTRGVAKICAIEIEPYAAGQRLGIVLAEEGIGAGRAGLGTFEAGFYSLGQDVEVDYSTFGVHLKHSAGVTHLFSFPTYG